jgi:hypothetical protein
VTHLRQLAIWIILTILIVLGAGLGWKYFGSAESENKISSESLNTPSPKFQAFEAKLMACLQPEVDIVCAKATVGASGFSHNTCRPRARAANAIAG